MTAKRILCLALYFTGAALFLLDGLDLCRGERWVPASIGPLEPVLRRVHSDVRGQFQAGDRVLEVQGRVVRRPADWYGVWDEPGRKVRVRYLHEGQTRDVWVTTQAREPAPWWGVVLFTIVMGIAAVTFGGFLGNARTRENVSAAAGMAMAGVVLANKHMGLWWLPPGVETALLLLIAGIPVLFLPALGWRYGRAVAWVLTVWLAVAGVARLLVDYQSVLSQGVRTGLELGTDPMLSSTLLALLTYGIWMRQKFREDDAALARLSVPSGSAAE